MDVSPKSSPSRVACTVGYSDGCLRTFDSKQMARRVKMKPHDSAVTSVQYCTDGESPTADSNSAVTALPLHPAQGPGCCLGVLGEWSQ